MRDITKEELMYVIEPFVMRLIDWNNRDNEKRQWKQEWDKVKKSLSKPQASALICYHKDCDKERDKDSVYCKGHKEPQSPNSSSKKDCPYCQKSDNVHKYHDGELYCAKCKYSFSSPS